MALDLMEWFRIQGFEGVVSYPAMGLGFEVARYSYIIYVMIFNF